MPFFTFSCTESCLLSLPLAIIPSILWLAFFYASATHREKIWDISRVAAWGVFIAIPVTIIELGFQWIFIGDARSPTPLGWFLYIFVGISLVEEFAKYAVVRAKVVGRTFFNQPQDAVLYMVAAALGFAAIENLVYAAALAQSHADVFFIILQRGVTATSLHVIASASLGYFLAISLRAEVAQERFKTITVGVIFATMLHGLYNTFIINIERNALAHEGLSASIAFSWSLVAILLALSCAVVLIAFRALAPKQ